MSSGSRHRLPDSLRGFCLRLGLPAVAALVLLVTLSPSRPTLRLPRTESGALGVAAGLLLYLGVARCRPVLPRGAGRLPVALTSCAVLGLAATTEEIVWRRTLLGELLSAGTLAALLGSSLGFALAHRRQALHLGTGVVFGSVYMATGAIAACILAHWVYNVLLLWLADGAVARGAPP
jgi:membrane protease YdiL (CAAX protease family)